MNNEVLGKGEIYKQNNTGNIYTCKSISKGKSHPKHNGTEIHME